MWNHVEVGRVGENIIAGLVLVGLELGVGLNLIGRYGSHGGIY